MFKLRLIGLQIYRDKNSKDSFRLLFWIYLETKFYSLLLFQLDCCQKKDYFCKFLQQAKFTEHQAEYKENKFKPFLQQNFSFFLSSWDRVKRKITFKRLILGFIKHYSFSWSKYFHLLIALNEGTVSVI